MKKKILIYLLIVLAIIGIYYNATVINTKQVTVRQVTIENNKLDITFNNTIVAYFSDIHYGFNDVDYLKKAVDKINQYNPDIVLFGGDLIQKDKILSSEDRMHIQELLSSLECNLGKYAVLGDEDNSTSKSLLENGGFIVLENEGTTIYQDKSFINLLGIEVNGPASNSELDLSHYTIALSHYPDNVDKLINKADYVLSGHSLGGQFIIFNKPQGATNYNKGIKNISGTILDISNGAGLTNKNARLLADGEIVIYKLVSD